MSALDVGARGLALQAGRRTDRALLLERLTRGIARGGTTPTMASPPTIGTPSGTSAVTGTLVDAVSNTQRFSFLRASWAAAGPGYPLNGFWRPTAVNSGGYKINGGSQPLVRFWSDAAVLEIVNRGSGGGYRLKVDGQYAGAFMAHNQAGTTQIYTSVDWAGVRKARLYEIEGVANFDFGGVKLGATSQVWPAPASDGVRVLIHGDSFVESGLGWMPGPLLGQVDTRGVGLGATGFIANASGARDTFLQRVSDVILPLPEVIVELGGINDEAQSGAAVQAAVNVWLNTVQAALPNALIFMTGPMSPGTPPANRLAIRDAKQAACAGRANCIFIDNLAEGWVTGSGKVGSPTGSGNADWITSSDNTHPSEEGYAYLANRLVQAIAARIPRS